jgi:hypothetical protein
LKWRTTAICDPNTDYAVGGHDRYCQLVERTTATDDGDEWSVEVLQGIGGGSGQIIYAANERVDAYLRGIEASWSLGPIGWTFRRKTA